SFLTSSVPHLYLHSFPTRRSSDLIGVTVHAFADVSKVFSVIAYMEHNELCPGMAGQYAVASLQQFPVTGKVAAVKRPICMVIQFLEALVEAIDRKEECLRI